MKGAPMTYEDLPAGDPCWVARQKVSLDELSAVGEALWWLQDSPQERTTRLMRLAAVGAPSPVSPPGFNVGGWLHGYGGGSYAVSGRTAWLVSGSDSGLYRLDFATGGLGAVSGGDGFLYGDLRACPAGLLAVRGADDGDELILVDHGGERIQVLTASAGFLAGPCLRGQLLAFLEWDEDQAPWDGSRLVVARRAPDGSFEQAKVVAGGAAESVVQPAWGPDGALYYMSDRSGWWNLYRWDGQGNQPVAPMDRDCAPAPWEAGYRSFAFLPGGKITLTVQHGLSHGLAVAGADGTTGTIDVPLTYIKPYLAAVPGGLAVIGSAPGYPPAVFSIDVTSGTVNEAASAAHTAGLQATVGERRQLPHGDRLRFLLHRPAGDGPFPLIIRAHAGPTDEVRDRLDWTKEFFLAHGFAVAEVVYRGSAGLGRAFRTSLNGHWGAYDVEDCLTVAGALLAGGTALPGAVFLSGSSAGGYTALQAACVPGSPLTAVTGISAIVDPADWAVTAPRFQRPHARTLAGPAGKVRAARVRIPVLLVHGRGDDVAPAAEAERLSSELRARDSRHEGLFFDGVGHYLSAPEALAEALAAELAFYRRFLS
jgi:dipeptidyl aminopeptidase/acylaminoacyl peptidase